jgi:hypothetical protein
MRYRLMRTLVIVTAVIVVGISAVFAFVENQ